MMRLPARAVATVLAFTVLLSSAACTGDDDNSDPDPSPSETAATTVEPKATIVKVTGKLDKKRRQPARNAVAGAVDRWLEKAYVAGDFPRKRQTFVGKFPGFTPVATRRADRQLGLMSSAAIAPKIDGVEVRKKEIDLDVLAAGGLAKAATARVQMVFRTSGELESRQVVKGEVYLVPNQGNWRVFGFDISRNQSATNEG